MRTGGGDEIGKREKESERVAVVEHRWHRSGGGSRDVARGWSGDDDPKVGGK